MDTLEKVCAMVSAGKCVSLTIHRSVPLGLIIHYVLIKIIFKDGAPGWLSGLKPLPLAQIVIPGSWLQAPHGALCSAGSLLPPLSLPASLPTCDLSLSNKEIKILNTHTHTHTHTQTEAVH